jgi:hypothetical protein
MMAAVLVAVIKFMKSLRIIRVFVGSGTVA